MFVALSFRSCFANLLDELAFFLSEELCRPTRYVYLSLFVYQGRRSFADLLGKRARSQPPCGRDTAENWEILLHSALLSACVCVCVCVVRKACVIRLVDGVLC